jgi:hypothetical protein
MPNIAFGHSLGVFAPPLHGGNSAAASDAERGKAASADRSFAERPGTPAETITSLNAQNRTAPVSAPPSSARLAANASPDASPDSKSQAARPGQDGANATGATNANDPGTSKSATGEPLTKEQEAQVRELKQRDAEVRAHEQAHAAVGGPYASAPSYTFTKGPDGKKYAVGGEVQIDTSPERTPDATIRKMDIVIRAALAPAEPSSQDRAVARQAQSQRLEAQQQRMEQQEAERSERTTPGEVDPASGAASAEGLSSPLQLQNISPEDARDAEQDAADAKQAATAHAMAAEAYAAAAQLFGG